MSLCEASVVEFLFVFDPRCQMRAFNFTHITVVLRENNHAQGT